jgi:23S rRNA (uracil1939-C5)-methyltransferase
MSATMTIEEIFDLYCGVGLLSLWAGEKDTKITGSDTNRMAIKSAQKNAVHLGFRSAKYSMSSVERFVQAAKIQTNSLVLINPPRFGCPPQVINGIASRHPDRIIIVSCSLKTHVLDLAEWGKKGYEILSLKAFDMFPLTDFLETVTELKIKR